VDLPSAVKYKISVVALRSPLDDLADVLEIHKPSLPCLYKSGVTPTF
jgi:hypothetical protein